MREIRHDSANPADGLRFFDFMRDELGTINRAIVVLAKPGSRDATSTLLVRDTKGNSIVLTGWQAATNAQRARTAARVLNQAGFARERTDVVFDHRVVRLTRTPDGQTIVQEATDGARLTRTNRTGASISEANAARDVRPVG